MKTREVRRDVASEGNGGASETFIRALCRVSGELMVNGADKDEEW